MLKKDKSMGLEFPFPEEGLIRADHLFIYLFIYFTISIEKYDTRKSLNFS